MRPTSVTEVNTGWSISWFGDDAVFVPSFARIAPEVATAAPVVVFAVRLMPAAWPAVAAVRLPEKPLRVNVTGPTAPTVAPLPRFALTSLSETVAVPFSCMPAVSVPPLPLPVTVFPEITAASSWPPAAPAAMPLPALPAIRLPAIVALPSAPAMPAAVAVARPALRISFDSMERSVCVAAERMPEPPAKPSRFEWIVTPVAAPESSIRWVEVRGVAPGSANAVAAAPITLRSTVVPSAPACTRTAIVNPYTDRPRISASVAVTSRPVASVVVPCSCTSGRPARGNARPAVPTVPPVPSRPALVSPTLTVCVVPSTTTPAFAIAGSTLPDTVTATTPSALRPFATPLRMPGTTVPPGTMKIDVSLPAGSGSGSPVRDRRCPICSRSAWSVKAAAFSRNWRIEPWPESLRLTIVEKLKPKSTPATSASPTVIGATACAVPPDTPVPALNT